MGSIDEVDRERVEAMHLGTRISTATGLVLLAVVVFAPRVRAVVPGVNGKIAFVSDRSGNYEIYVMNADGSNQVDLTNSPSSDQQPAWSPDGGKIAFTTTRDGNNEIYVMNADGSNQVDLTNSLSSDLEPDWSPDGAAIAFTTTRDGNEEIYLMNADGADPTDFTNLSTNESEPAWSPGGASIAFTTDHDGNNNVYVKDLGSGIKLHRITESSAKDLDPSWSPDGAKIAFTTSRDGNEEIYVMNADGTLQTDLTSNMADDWDSDWQSVAVPIGSSIASFSPTQGQVGTQVTITGTSFTGATAVTFGEVAAATFSVVSATQITAAVPVGASAGPIAVTTSAGTSTSVTDFVVEHARLVSLALAGHASGTVRVPDGFSACASRVPIKIQHRAHGTWRTVASVLSKSAGAYRAGGVRDPGSYRAVAKRTTLQSGDVCLKRTSRVANRTGSARGAGERGGG